MVVVVVIRMGRTRSSVPRTMAASSPSEDSLLCRLMLSTSRMALLTTMPHIMITPIQASPVKLASRKKKSRNTPISAIGTVRTTHSGCRADSKRAAVTM